MVLPELEGSEASRNAGARFLSEIYQNDSIKTPLQIIGLTEYDAEFSELQQEFKDKLWYLLYYSRTSDDWKEQLKTKVFQLGQYKKSVEDEVAKRGKFDIGVICALRSEFNQMQKAFSRVNWTPFQIEGLPYPFKIGEVTTRSFKDLKIVAGCTDKPGMCPTSILATTMYTQLGVDTIFMTGITAGIHYDDLRLDDIIIADSIMDYASGKLAENQEGEIKLLKEVNQIQANRSLISKMANFISEDKTCEVINSDLRDNNLKEGRENIMFRIAKTVCGPYVMAAPQIIEELKKDDRKLQALDMEGFGLYLTAHTLDKKALWIKGVSDFADAHKGDNRHKACSYASAKLLYEFIREMM
jgi:nucleoside phosphorylase